MTRTTREEGFETVDFRTAMDTGENDDGWVDAGHEQTGGSGPRQESLIDMDPGLSNGFDTSVSSASRSHDRAQLAPLRPQPTNNPFLKHKSQESVETVHGKENEHADAWAELIPSGHDNDAGSDSPKGKARARDDLFEDRQPDDRVTAGMSTTSSAQQTNDASRLPPPPPRNQTYTIKHVRWLDHTAGDSIRTTPILMQNLNGPCPLLALVNAITMSTPPGAGASLFETLRTREQVSLNLLLEAIVEELMTGQGGNQAELPDMVELFDFLTALHTGMNVNPAFVAPDEVPNLMDLEPGSPRPNSSSDSAGGFESTKEMRLYSTFAVPLVHGWLPPRSHPAYPALKRSAVTHEDAEILLTREDELEDRLRASGLSEEEQRVLEDIGTIKYFLNSSTTQLTEYGLDVIRDTMFPGSFSILFRNNHFSTLYKHPLTGHIFSLITDMGYAKYDEIVWESLVDVNGAGAELFSGDFRVVSHNSQQETGKKDVDHQNSTTESTQDWVTVDHNRNRQSRKPIARGENLPGQAPTNASSSDMIEQEDADLALALQLQEEEEENARRQSTPARPPQSIPPRGQPISPESQHGRHRSSQTQPASPAQSGRIYTPPPQQAQRRGNRLVVRTGNSQRDQVLLDSSANSSNSAIERPLRGAQPSNSPFADGQTPPRGRRQRTADPEAPADEPPPPSYESALEDEPYIPPENSAHHHASPLPSPTSAHPSRNSGPLSTNFDDVLSRTQARSNEQPQQLPQRRPLQQHSTQESIYTVSQPASRTRRRSSGAAQIWPTERSNKEKDCVVM